MGKFFELLAKMWTFRIAFGQGVLYTVLLSAFTVLLGFCLALLIALARRSRLKPLSILATVYVELVRGTPMLVQLFLVFYGLFSKNALGQFLPTSTILGYIDLSRFIPGIVALSMNSGAYLSETIRAGISSIDYGQTEAARSLGMTQKQTMRLIVLPQAIKNILPAIGNEFVTIIKESSVCAYIGMYEIMYAAQLVQGSTFIIVQPLIVASLLYLCLTIPTSKIIGHFERRMSRGDVR
ncbi:MAG: amino acid ABC transporter permease [Oscillospiraceae bacterium]|nr:amino acid ABC transporter permease [Oscillospiraceae bacterium]